MAPSELPSIRAVSQKSSLRDHKVSLSQLPQTIRPSLAQCSLRASGSELPQTSSPSLTPAPQSRAPQDSPELCSPRLSTPSVLPRFAPSEPLSHTGPSDPVLLRGSLRASLDPELPQSLLSQHSLRVSGSEPPQTLRPSHSELPEKAWLPQPALPPSEPCSLSTPADLILLTAPQSLSLKSSLRSPFDL